jgi:hypothetical protein
MPNRHTVKQTSSIQTKAIRHQQYVIPLSTYCNSHSPKAQTTSSDTHLAIGTKAAYPNPGTLSSPLQTTKYTPSKLHPIDL